MSIKSWPSDSRPREKLLEQGAQHLADAELLALFIRTGQRGQSALDLARTWLAKTGGLRRLLQMSYPDASALPGLGLARFAELHAAKELVRRALGEELQRGETMHGFADAARLAQMHLRDLHTEVVLMMSFDARLRFIAVDELARGSAHCVNITPRHVVVKALERNAEGVVLAHNHPSGCKEPSQADIAFTRQVRDALSSMQMRLHDHILIADGPPVSIQALGY